MTAHAARIAVVLDINVYLDHIRGGTIMAAPDQLPTASAASDTLSLAFDEQVRLFASPHILRNIARVMHNDGQSGNTISKFVGFISEVCSESGGAIVDPVVRDYAIGDHEDNNILALARDENVNADVVVSSDKHLLDLGPAWNGRLIMRPRSFVTRLSNSRQAPAVIPPLRPLPTPSPAPRVAPAGSLLTRFPELRDVQVSPTRFSFSETDSENDRTAEL